MNDKNWENLEPTFSLVEDRLRILKQALPEAFTDGKINFDSLKELLGEAIADDQQDEHFGLSWTGKREARKLAGMPSKGTLVPVKGKGLHEDTTENIFIEGDNLEVLKLLHKSYYGKIKMIFIDPPYNRGDDLIYKDDYSEPLESYLQRSGQMNEMDEMLTSNPKSSGRFHSDWLNMMYPRLRVARDLLHDDGVIFISLDDNEVSNLRQLMNEVFGEENFLGTIIWKKKTNGNNMGYLPPVHDYIIAFAKLANENSLHGFALSKEYLDKNYSNPDNDERGLWTTSDLSANHKGPYFEIANEKTGEVFLPPSGRYWVFNETEVLKRIKEGRIIFGKSGEGRPIQKVFLNERKSLRYKAETLWDKHGMNEDGTKEIGELLAPKVFEHSKPTQLIKHIIDISSKDKDLILDFFAGSGTTGQAVIEQNIKDGGNRKFICVQIDEKIDEKSEALKVGFRTISEITVERIRRASKKIEAEIDAGLPLSQKPDLGFKFYRLERSNFKAWSDYQGTNLDELRGLLQEQVATSFVPDSTKEGILTEILLLEGFPLDSDISQDGIYERNTVWRVSSEFSEHRLFITLDDEIWEETVSTAEELESNDIFICLDKALSDESKIRMSDVCRLKVI